MASASPLEEIDEKFLQCSICLDRLKEPKILPCLHRYCRDCLNKIVNEEKTHDSAELIDAEDTEIECPTCRATHSLPPGGVDDFKTDFNTNNIVEYIESRSESEEQSFTEDADQSKVTDNVKSDANSENTRESIEHESTSDKQSATADAPRCASHPDKDLELCCVTCNTLPICIPCMYSDHKTHDLQDVVSLSETERKRLTYKLKLLMPFKEQLYKMQEQARNAQEKLDFLVRTKETELDEELNREEEKTKGDTMEMDEKLAERKARMDNAMTTGTSAKKQKLEKEMAQASQKYNKLRHKYIEVCEEENKEAESELRRLQEENQKEKTSLFEKLGALNRGAADLMASIKKQENEISEKIVTLSDELEEIVRKIEDVEITSASLLESKQVWKDVRSVNSICQSIDTVIESIRGKVRNVESVTGMTIRGLSAIVPSRPTWPTTTEAPEHVAEIGDNDTGTWRITGITCSPEGNVVISGETSPYNSHITEIDINGRCIWEERISASSSLAWRYCDWLSPHKLATVCKSNEIGVYNTKSGKYKKHNIGDLTSAWPQHRAVSCVATDQKTKHIFVCGKDARDVSVFDNHLKFVRTVMLPDEIKSPCDVAIHREGNPLVCDGGTKKAFFIKVDGLKGKINQELAKPHPDRADWSPYSVCTDTKGLIYLLWGTEGSDQFRRVLVQYGPNGRHLLKTRTVDKDSWCITTMETARGEKLLIATYNTRKLITYGLVSSVHSTMQRT